MFKVNMRWTEDDLALMQKLKRYGYGMKSVVKKLLLNAELTSSMQEKLRKPKL